jgi:pyrimidine-specific ribonucleoside hydrolase
MQTDTRTLMALTWILPLVTCAGGQFAPPAEEVSARVEPSAIWMDVDPSTAPGGYALVINDDGLAWVQAFHSPEVAVRGVGAVFGNAALEETYPVAREVVDRFGPPALGVFQGAASGADLGVETDASRALAEALGRERLTVLSLGPVTNLATVVRNHPELHGQIDRVVAVAGRRPGQRFVASTTTSEPLMDLNFELDAPGFQVLLDSAIPIVLAPFEISSKVLLTEREMDRLQAGDEAVRWLAQPASDWLEWWKKRFSVDGFYPFDTLAVAYVTTPDWLDCEQLPAEIQRHPDDVKVPSMGAAAPEKPYLVVAPEIGSGRTVTYCHDVDAAFKDDLMDRLLAQR